MDFEHIQFSTVVSAKSHNPSILNPDFLRMQRIVHDSWNWEVAETVSTPAVSFVRYTNGVQLTVHEKSLQVVDIEKDPASSNAAEIAMAYVHVLSHVHYLAAGINFQTIVRVPSPDSYLRDRFVKPGPWNSDAHRLKAAGVRLVYPLPPEGGRFVLSLDGGTTKKRDTPETNEPVIIANANFHRPCTTQPSSEELLAHLAHVKEDWSLYQTVLRDALATKG